MLLQDWKAKRGRKKTLVSGNEEVHYIPILQMQEESQHQVQGGKGWDHFSHEAPEAWTPTPTFSDSERKRDGGVREAEKVHWCLISLLSQKEGGKWMKWMDPKKGPWEQYDVHTIRVEQKLYIFISFILRWSEPFLSTMVYLKPEVVTWWLLDFIVSLSYWPSPNVSTLSYKEKAPHCCLWGTSILGHGAQLSSAHCSGLFSVQAL